MRATFRDIKVFIYVYWKHFQGKKIIIKKVVKHRVFLQCNTSCNKTMGEILFYFVFITINMYIQKTTYCTYIQQ